MHMQIAESAWYKHQCAYFKIPNHMEEVLSRTTLGIPYGKISPPLPAFAMLFEENQEIKSAALAIAPPTISMVYRSRGMTWGIGLEYAEDVTVQKSLSEYGLDPIVQRLFRIAIAICIISTNQKAEFLTADVLSRDRDKYGTANVEQKKQIEERAHRRGKKGWFVNHEQAIPRPRNPKSPTNGEDRAHELSYQHLRCGHFSAVHCGTGRTQIKLVWKKMTVVRPDLPLNPNATKGYKL
jgi:hypothetical protein